MKANMRNQSSHILCVLATIILLPACLLSQTTVSTPDSELLKVREQVWRAWFDGDSTTLEKLVPPGTIVISNGEEKWKNQADVIRTSAEFHKKGGKLIRLEFPHTDVQHFGDTAIVWSSYLVETELEGKQSVDAGRATEIFVLQAGQWTNPGWHTSSTK
jgi:enamine deaminase RidA (YjgF/YER057c/UK114 family)